MEAPSCGVEGEQDSMRYGGRAPAAVGGVLRVVRPARAVIARDASSSVPDGDEARPRERGAAVSFALSFAFSPCRPLTLSFTFCGRLRPIWRLQPCPCRIVLICDRDCPYSIQIRLAGRKYVVELRPIHRKRVKSILLRIE